MSAAGDLAPPRIEATCGTGETLASYTVALDLTALPDLPAEAAWRSRLCRR